MSDISKFDYKERIALLEQQVEQWERRGAEYQAELLRTAHLALAEPQGEGDNHER